VPPDFAHLADPIVTPLHKASSHLICTQSAFTMSAMISGAMSVMGVFWLTVKVNSDPGAVYAMALCLSVRVCLSVTSRSSTTRSSAIAEGPHNASCQLKSHQVPRNSAETTCTTSPEQIEVMKLEDYRWPMCNKHVHSTMTRSSRFRCPVGVINKPTTVELWISPVYRRLAVAKFSKSTMQKLLT